MVGNNSIVFKFLRDSYNTFQFYPEIANRIANFWLNTSDIRHAFVIVLFINSSTDIEVLLLTTYAITQVAVRYNWTKLCCCRYVFIFENIFNISCVFFTENRSVAERPLPTGWAIIHASLRNRSTNFNEISYVGKSGMKDPCFERAT